MNESAAKVQQVSLRGFGFFGRTRFAICFSDPTPIRFPSGGFRMDSGPRLGRAGGLWPSAGLLRFTLSAAKPVWSPNSPWGCKARRLAMGIAFGHLKKFLKGRYTVRAERAQRTVDEMHIELMALPEVQKDFTTPEGAILCLRDAYRRKDIEAAVAAKDFNTEARLMMEKTGFKICINDENVAKAAEALELSFRAHTIKQWPDFDGLESFFPKRERLRDGIVVVTEVCRFPDGFFSRQEILVAETNQGWRVLNPRKDDKV